MASQAQSTIPRPAPNKKPMEFGNKWALILLRRLNDLPDEEAKWPNLVTMGFKQLDFFEEVFELLLIYDEEAAAHELVADSFGREMLRSADHSHAKLAAEQLRGSVCRYVYVLDLMARGNAIVADDGIIAMEQPWERATERYRRAARDFLDWEEYEHRAGRWEREVSSQEAREVSAMFQ